jgi:uncharacterized membrane protein
MPEILVPHPDARAGAADPTTRLALHSSIASLIALIFLCLAWELRLAPIHPGGSWLALKCLPLLLPLRGVLHGRRYTYQWLSMLILAYFGEGIVRATTEHGMAQALALVEIVLSLILFVASVAYAYRTRPSAQR